jgi:hypothetical protein
MKRHVVLMSALLGVVACSQSSDGGPAVTARPDGDAPPASAAAAVKTEAEVVNGPNTLALKPGHVFACDGRERTVSTITWRSTDPAVAKVAIMVQSPEDTERKLFTIGGSEGSAETGNWVVGGSRVFMVDEPTGKELASHTVTALPCT